MNSLKRVWFDTVTQIPLAIRYALDFSGVDKLMFSSDHPWVQPQAIIDAVDGASLSQEQREKVY
jgi:predicted TIM-barrel fold metal-dependent hydrolase